MTPLSSTQHFSAGHVFKTFIFVIQVTAQNSTTKLARENAQLLHLTKAWEAERANLTEEIYASRQETEALQFKLDDLQQRYDKLKVRCANTFFLVSATLFH